MIFLELKKKALSVIFSQVKIIKAKGYIRGRSKVGASVPNSAPISAINITKEKDTAGAVTPSAILLDGDLYIKELDKADGVVAPEIKAIKATICFNDEAINDGAIALRAQYIDAKEDVGDKSKASVDISTIKEMESKSYDCIQGLITASTDEALSIVAEQLASAKGNAALELIGLVLISTLDNSAQLSSSAQFDELTADRVYAKDYIKHDTSVALGVLQKKYIADYYQTVINDIKAKNLVDLTTIKIL